MVPFEYDITVPNSVKSLPVFGDRLYKVTVLKCVIIFMPESQLESKSGDPEIRIRFPTRDRVPPSTNLRDKANI